jgi:hypothetical protein
VGGGWEGGRRKGLKRWRSKERKGARKAVEEWERGKKEGNLLILTSPLAFNRILSL